MAGGAGARRPRGERRRPPLDDPSPLGTVLCRLRPASTIVLALRSSTRALPLVLLGAGARRRRRPHRAAASGCRRRRWPPSVAVVVLAAVNLPTLWNGTYVDAPPAAAVGHPGVLAPGGRRPDAPADDGTPRPRAARRRVRRLPLGHHHRPDPARAHRSPDAHPRPAAARRRRPRWTCSTPSTTGSRRASVEPAEPSPRSPGCSAPAPSSYRGDTAFERYRTARPEPTWSMYDDRRARPRPAGDVRPAGRQPSRPSPDSTRRRCRDPRIGQPVPPAAVVPVEDPLPDRAGPRRRRASPSWTAAATGIVDAAAAGLLDDPRHRAAGGVRSPATPERPPRRHPPGRPHRHRHQPQAGRAVARLAGHHRLHRGRRRRRAAGRRSRRQPAPRVPRRRHRRADAGRAARRRPRRGQRLRRAERLPPRGPRRPGHRRRSRHRVARRATGARSSASGCASSCPAASAVDHLTVVQPLDRRPTAGSPASPCAPRPARRRVDLDRRVAARPPASASTVPGGRRDAGSSWRWPAPTSGRRPATSASTPSGWPRCASTAWPPPTRWCGRRPTCSTPSAPPPPTTRSPTC